MLRCAPAPAPAPTASLQRGAGRGRAPRAPPARPRARPRPAAARAAPAARPACRLSLCRRNSPRRPAPNHAGHKPGILFDGGQKGLKKLPKAGARPSNPVVHATVSLGTVVDWVKAGRLDAARPITMQVRDDSFSYL